MAMKNAMEMVSEAKGRITNLSVEAFAKEMESGNAVVIDVREKEELDGQGFIPGAVHAPRGLLEFYADPSHPLHKSEFSPEKRLLLHCASGGRGALACDMLQGMGYSNVANLESGFKGWKEAGKPSEKT